ncbi:MAG TPA: hypothetical protein ENI96_06600 [Sedimenticola thiotaurini]|uniref:Uncharacterized protein n=1 Tax=Sedimenticola thiotaurini TaxID=1543721 RepID=A0A831W748_9GAMM|nr:hypothetical protein [Sedimenticola thiotaurini]
MAIKGVWNSEIAGPYGWEPVGVLFLKKGHVHGGGAHHYTEGRYRKQKDGSIRFEVEIHQFGKKRPLFGREREHFPMVAHLEPRGDFLQGEAHIPGRRDHRIQVRYRRVGKYPD